MKTRFSAAIVVIVLSGIGLSIFSSGRSPGDEPAKAPTRVKWEYKVVPVAGGAAPGIIDVKTLLDLGEDGWELHSVSDSQPYVISSTTRFTFGKPDNTSISNTINYTRAVYYFKRAK